LALGVAGLGFWANGQHANRMETAIAAASAPLVAGSVHGATVAVMGRDIQINGIIDGTTERDALVSALDTVPGRRVVRFDTATVLDTVAPFTASLTKAEGGAFTSTGHLPTEALRASMAGVTSADAVAGLTLAAGAPAEFSGLAVSGATALAAMVSGDLSNWGTRLYACFEYFWTWTIQSAPASRPVYVGTIRWMGLIASKARRSASASQ
jgi:hypothetical protein